MVRGEGRAPMSWSLRTEGSSSEHPERLSAILRIALTRAEGRMPVAQRQAEIQPVLRIDFRSGRLRVERTS
jgi:hypothetical protein